MSTTVYLDNTTREELVDYLTREQEADTGIPINLFSVVNAQLDHFNKVLGITDNKKGCFFLEEEHSMKAYGDNNWVPMLNLLNCIGLETSFN